MLTINIITFFVILISAHQYSAADTETISRQKCREYGQTINSCNLSNDKVVQYGQFPHIASIGYDVENEIKYRCSGVLISNQYILSTSYCGHSRNAGPAIRAKLGALYFEHTNNETHTQEIKITKVIIHPKYKLPEKYNDISLLKLEHPVEINEYVRPACLPDLNEEQDKYIVTGWEVFDNIDSEKFLTAYFNIFEIPNQECNTSFNFSPRYLKNGIDAKSHFCAAPTEIVCKMLGGTPLQTFDKNVNCMYDIHGISSFGSKCSSPTIFTKIAPYINWIEQIIWS